MNLQQLDFAVLRQKSGVPGVPVFQNAETPSDSIDKPGTPKPDNWNTLENRCSSGFTEQNENAEDFTIRDAWNTGTPWNTSGCSSDDSVKNNAVQPLNNSGTPGTPGTPENNKVTENKNAFTNFPDPKTPGHHWLDLKRGWIQSAVEKKPRGHIGQTLTNPTDSAELAELLIDDQTRPTEQPLLQTPQPLGTPSDFESDPLAGLPLLPDDRRFITQQLHRIPHPQHDAVLAEYRQTWLEAAEQEPLEHRKENTGRRAANLYLLRINQ